jgi:hypothetical protein
VDEAAGLGVSDAGFVVADLANVSASGGKF